MRIGIPNQHVEDEPINKITDVENGVSDFSFSDDGRWLVYRSGESGQEQLYSLPVNGLLSAEAEQLTDGEAGVDGWEWSPDSRRIYFTRPDSRDEDDELRREEMPRCHLAELRSERGPTLARFGRSSFDRRVLSQVLQE